MRKVLLLALLFPSVALAQGARYGNTAFSAAGRPLGGANVSVCSYPATQGVGGAGCTPLITIYSDKALTTPISQTDPAHPFVTDGFGNYAFWVSPVTCGPSNACDIQVSGPGITTTLFPFTVGGSGSVGTGCTLSGVDTGVLSEHPLGTCFDSSHWTWDDGASKQNMQAGLSNAVGSASQLTFNFGQNNSICNHVSITTCLEVYVQGMSNDVESSGANSGDVFNGVWVQGRNNFFAGKVTDSYIFGGGSNASFGNALGTDASSRINSVMCLTQGCNQGGGGINSFGGANIQFSIFGGFQNTATANGASATMQDVLSIGAFNTYHVNDTSIMSSIFTYGESDTVNSNTNCTMQDFYHLGQFDTATCNASGGQLLKNYSVGISNTFITNTATTNQINTATGHSLSFTNCSHHFMFGESGTCSGSSTPTATLGVSTAPEISTTAGHATLNAHLDQSATGKLGGTCSMSTATSCTFTLGAAFVGTPICITNVQGSTAIAGACAVSGTTVTITAASSNSQTWGAILIGNPN